jgi:hypothetical protein
MYSATKRASLSALHKVYGWALAQPLHPVYASEYIERVLDFNQAVVARTADGWLVRGLESLRTLRAPRSLGEPQGDVAGFVVHEGQSYVHLTRGEAEVRFMPAAASPLPYLERANAKVTAFERTTRGATLSLEGHVPIEFTLAHAGACDVRHAGRRVARSADGRYRLPDVQAHGIDIRCP